MTMATVTKKSPRFEFAHAASATAAPDWGRLASAPRAPVFVNVVMGAADSTPDQAWFWTTAWQAGEWEAAIDLEAGRTEHFDSGAAFLEALRALAQE